MKRLLFFIAFTAALISCEEVLTPDNNDDTNPLVFSVENKEITVSALASSVQIMFSSSGDWKASLVNDRASSWVELASRGGEAGEDLSLGLTFCKNEDGADRSAVVRLASGNENIDVVVTQKHEGTILMSPSRLDASRDGRSFSIEVAAEGDFSYEIIGQAKEWIEAVLTKSGADNSLQFMVSPNPGKKRRSGNIVFRANSVSETVTIYQAGEAYAQDMVVSSRSHEIASNGENVQIEIAYGRNVSLVIPESYGWLKEINTASTNTYNLDVAANDGYEHRIGYVLVVDDVTGKTESVSILQWQKDAIVFSKDRYDIALSGGEIDLKFAANCDYEVEILPAGTDWVTPMITRSMADRAETFEVAPAAAGTDRTCVIAFSNGKVRQEITVRQWACDAAITFADPIVKDRCVELYDTDGDKELSYIEASEVKSIVNLFCEVEPLRRTDAEGNIIIGYRPTVVRYGDNITSFDELRYFTGLVEIPAYAFYMCRQLTSLTLPSSIESIGRSAFSGANQLRELRFPEGIRTIGSIPSGLETLILPEGVEQVELTGNLNLKTISMPASIRMISSASDFQANIDWSGTAVTSDKKFVVNDKGELLLYLGSDADCVVPEGVRTIYPATFVMPPSSVTSLSLPSTLEIPEWNCLRYFENLESVRGKFAASDGKSLVHEGKLIGVVPVAESYEFPASVTSVGVGAFCACRNIKEITLPLWMDYLPEGMFSSCGSLEKVNNLQNVKRLEDTAFYGCNKLLKRFKVLANVNYIGKRALYSSVGGSIIEFESLTPPELYADWNEDGTSIEAVFGPGTTVYVPDMAFDKYNSYTYSSVWPKVEARKVSVLYSEPEVEVKAEGEDIIVTIGEAHYRFIKVQKGSFSRSVPQTGEQVTVNLTRDYYIGETEVSQSFWDALTHFNPSVYPGLHCPVISVSYNDCVDFAKKLSGLTSINFRLPTEAEWEYASLGGHTGRWNNEYYDYVGANVDVFSGQPNALGLLCMFGNVWEYCEDDYSAWTDMASVPSGDDPLVEIEGSVRKVIRGGDVIGRKSAIKSNSQNTQYGFRLVLTM